MKTPSVTVLFHYFDYILVRTTSPDEVFNSNSYLNLKVLETQLELHSEF